METVSGTLTLLALIANGSIKNITSTVFPLNCPSVIFTVTEAVFTIVFVCGSLSFHTVASVLLLYLTIS